MDRDGRAFTIYKFRTMVVDAEERKEHLPALNDSDGVLFEMRRDPRVKAAGCGCAAGRYGDHVRRRLAVKPGITGLWQVNVRMSTASGAPGGLPLGRYRTGSARNQPATRRTGTSCHC